MNKIQLIFQGQLFVKEASEYGLYLDYSFESIQKLEEYCSNNILGKGKAKNKSIFAKDTDDALFNMGVYVGEVLRSNSSNLKWKVDLETPYMTHLLDNKGNAIFPINKSYKRFYEGAEDNIYHFVVYFSKEFISNNDECPKDFFDEEDNRINKFGIKSKIGILNNKNNPDHPIDYAYYKDGIWILSTEKNEKLDIDDCKFLFIEELKEKYPELEDILNYEGDDYRADRNYDGTYRTQILYRGALNNTAMASFQGNMTVNIFQWIKYYPKDVIKGISYLIFSFILMKYVHWSLGILFIVAVLYNIWYWYACYFRFRGGDVNPGKIISLSPTLVAVRTNLTKGVGDYPVLEIIQTNLPEEDLIINKIIPTVAIYHNNPHGYPFWAEFFPVPIIHGIKDRLKLNYFLKNFSSNDLDSLNKAIDEVGIKKIGTYKLNANTSDWSNYPHVDINKGVKMEGPSKTNK